MTTNIHVSKQAEKAYLGSLLQQASNENFYDCAHLVQSHWFYFKANKIVHAAILELLVDKMVIDDVSVVDLIAGKQLLDEIGGRAYLIELQEGLYSLSSAPTHAGIIKNKYIARMAVDFLIGAHSQISSTEDSVSEQLEGVCRRIEKISDEFSTSEFRDCKDILISRLKKLSQPSPPVIKTGYAKLDSLLTIRPSNLVTIAARPAVGKTAFALSIAKHVSQTDTVLFYSLEMSGEELSSRLLAMESGIPMGKLEVRELLNPHEWQKITGACAKLAELKLKINEHTAASLLDIRTQIRKHKRDFDVKLVIIDYLQLMNTARSYQNRNDEIAQITRELKCIAKDFDVAIIALSQLNRKAEENAKPQLSNLRDSGAIEQDSDSVLFLCPPTSIHASLEVIIAKQRQGALGSVEFDYYGDITLFKERP